MTERDYCSDCREPFNDTAERAAGICRECLANQSRD